MNTKLLYSGYITRMRSPFEKCESAYFLRSMDDRQRLAQYRYVRSRIYGAIASCECLERVKDGAIL